MATMCPDLPVTALPDTAEARLYLALRALPDDYRVYHSVSYYVAPEAGHPLREGEIDFLILHPDRGLLVVEVKGGEIGYDGRSKTWTSRSRGGESHEIKDPFRQAQNNEKSLVREMGRRGIFNGSGPSFVHGHAVAFPDCRYEPKRIPIGGLRDLVIDAADLERGACEAVERVFKTIRSGRDVEPMTKQLVKQIGQQVLAPHFQLATTLRDDLAAEGTAFVRLEKEQSTCLDFIEANPKVLIEGSAGTGKTIIACEAARRLASKGADVLLLCFNRPLAGRLSQFADSCRGEPGRIWAGSFHQLCREWAERAGLIWHEPSNPAGVAGFWNDASGLLLLDAARKIVDRFDALIIDEAQDFLPDWLEILQSLLRDSTQSRIVLLQDENQDIWGRSAAPAWTVARFPLRTNFRNTHAIGNYLGTLAPVKYRFPWSAPPGAEPEIIPCADAAEERQKAAGKIEWLLSQGITPDRIVLIGMHRLDKSFLAGQPCLAGLQVEAIDDRGLASATNVLRYSTPHRFKGLEADVVLLCDVEGDPKTCSPKNLYVAASRARHRLYVFTVRKEHNNT